MIPDRIDWQFPFCPLPPDWRIDWKLIEAELPWFAPLFDCPQDETWHAEGDVGVHTKMVCERLVELESWRNLNPVERQIVFCAALMHDMAKPLVTKQEQGRWRAPKHAAKGAMLAREQLYRQWLPTMSLDYLRIREQIVQLIRLHGHPLWSLEVDDPRRDVILDSQVVRCDLLAMVAEADVLGRHCRDQQELLDRVELYRELCRELNCTAQPYQFDSPATRWFYLQGRPIDPATPLRIPETCTVTLLSGLPGAGKDTWIAQHADGRPVISLDEIRRGMRIDPSDNQGQVINAAREQAREQLRSGTSFIWNATNISRQLRQSLIGFFTDYAAAVQIVYLETSRETLLARNRNRKYGVPEQVLDKMLAKFEVPAATEAHEVEWVVT